MAFRVTAGVNEDTLENAAAVAERVERLGFDGVDFTESAHDAFLPCVIAAEHSRTLTIGTSVAIAFPRSPMVTAMVAWDLQRYSGGRFVLGLGTQVKGHNERRFSVPWSPPAPRLREYVLAMRAIWRSFQEGVPLDYAGKHYAFTLMTPNFDPGPNRHGHVPVHLAALNEANARVAGEVADGIKLHPLNSPAYLRDVLLPAIETGLARSGRSRADFEICGGGLVASGRTLGDVERGVRRVKRWLSFYGSTRSYQNVLHHHGWHDITAKLHAMSLRGEWDAMVDVIPDEMVEQFAVVADYAHLAPALHKRYGGLVDSLGFTELLGAAEDDDAIADIVHALQREG
jgi:probable F420-dependent oxidoreductase